MRRLLVGLIVGLIFAVLIIAVSNAIGGIGEIIIILITIFICFGGVLFLTRNRLVKNYPQEALPFSTPIPTELQESHNELDLLGFKCVGEVDSKTYRQWIYFSEDRTVIAYMTYIMKPQVWFSSFLEDGLDITTHYSHGDFNETGKIISHVVKTSISAAYDYQLHHTQLHIAEHGEVKVFDNAKQLLEWEQEQEYGKVIFGQVVKLAGRLVIALVAMIILVVGMTISSISIYTSFIEPEADHLPNIVGWVITILSFVLPLTWALYPLFKPQTVESRKKRKAKEA